MKLKLPVTSFTKLFQRPSFLKPEPGPIDELLNTITELEKQPDNRSKFIKLAQAHLSLSNGYAIRATYGNTKENKLVEYHSQQHKHYYNLCNSI